VLTSHQSSEVIANSLPSPAVATAAPSTAATQLPATAASDRSSTGRTASSRNGGSSSGTTMSAANRLSAPAALLKPIASGTVRPTASSAPMPAASAVSISHHQRPRSFSNSTLSNSPPAGQIAAMCVGCQIVSSPMRASAK
jgi:hypothetical protein